jgi:hypothetical protein
MTNQIVTVNVAQTLAAAPSALQKTGAIVSVGATTLDAGESSLLTEEADLAAILTPAATIASMTWAGNVVTVTTTAPHGIPSGKDVYVTIAGATPSGYNGTFLATQTGTSTFTFPKVGDPGLNTVPGTWIPASVAELVRQVNTFFAQGSTVAVYVYETGLLEIVDAIAYLAAWITANPNVYYSWLVPELWADDSTFVDLAEAYVATTSKTYFFVTMALDNYADFADLKSVLGLVPSPDEDATEFSAAALFRQTLSYDPSTTNKVTPLAFSYLLDVTPWPLAGNGATFAALKAAGVNYVGTGAEGGISSEILFWGTTMDQKPFNYWYAVDWAQINLDLDLSNEVINGSNNPAAPLYYDQNGINRLQARAQATMDRGISYGLLVSPIEVAAVPFNVYVPANPDEYAAGAYGGLSATISASRGFTSITFNLNVTDIPVA